LASLGANGIVIKKAGLLANGLAGKKQTSLNPKEICRLRAGNETA